MKIGESIRVARIEGVMAPYEWPFPKDEAARIDAHWAGLCRLKPALYDGRVLLAHRFAVEADVLHVAYFEASYRSFISWRDFGFPGEPVVNCFSMAALVSADGAYMLGEMSPTTANGGRMYFPSGTPETKDLTPTGFVDLEGSSIRELEEETGLTRADVEIDAGWTIVRMSPPAIACMKAVTARETAVALMARLEANNAALDDPELSRLVPVRSAADFDPVHMPDFMLRYLSDATRT